MVAAPLFVVKQVLLFLWVRLTCQHPCSKLLLRPKFFSLEIPLVESYLSLYLYHCFILSNSHNHICGNFNLLFSNINQSSSWQNESSPSYLNHFAYSTNVHTASTTYLSAFFQLYNVKDFSFGNFHDTSISYVNLYIRNHDAAVMKSNLHFFIFNCNFLGVFQQFFGFFGFVYFTWFQHSQVFWDMPVYVRYSFHLDHIHQADPVMN